MADSNTTTYSFTLPEVGASADSWGTKLNANWDKVDDLLDGSIAVNGITVTGGSIDGTPVGATTPSTGAFTTVTTTGNVDVTGTVTADGLTVDGATTINQASDTNSYLTLDGASGAYLSLAATTGHISADSTLTLNTASSERMRIDSAGNVGIATVPKTWQSQSNALEIGELSIEDYEISGSNATNILFNGYRDTDNSFKRKVDGYSVRVGSYLGDFSVQLYGNGSADEVLTGSPAMRIDSSGNLLVGKTSANNTVVGIEAKSNGNLSAVADGITPALFRRKTSDGDIVEFAKDGSTVGSIGTNLSRVHIGSDDCRLFFDAGSTNAVWPWADTATSSGDADNTIDLGDSVNRFKDLYLSGGVYLGGTGAANKLDDYEEGSWTPTAVQGFTGFTVQNANYTKVGNMVTVWFWVSSTTGKSGVAAQIGGLPFRSSNGTYGFIGNSVIYGGQNTSGAETIYLGQNANAFVLTKGTTTGSSPVAAVSGSAIGNGTSIQGTLTYRTTA